MNTRTTLVTVSVLLSAAAANAQLLPHEWNLMGGRTLDVQFAANGGLPRPDLAGVNVMPGNPEPDPTAMDGMFTFGDAVRRAIGAWNDANGGAGWRLNLIAPGAPAANPLITVKLDVFNFPIQPPHMGASADAIALFVPGATNGAGKLLDAQILFNVKPGVDWGIGKNQMDGTDDDLKFDPINTAIHEFGHAFRLDHPAAGGTLSRMNAGNASAMLPITDSGVHKLNPNPGAGFNRYPNAVDIAAAAGSLPAPGPLALAVFGLVAISGRRR